MTQPAVNITELDGSLGVLPASSGRLFAIVGAASAGPINSPATFARVKDIVANFVSGPAVEAAAEYIAKYAKPVLFVRSGNSATTPAAQVSAVTSVQAASGSVVTISSTPTPNDDYEFALKIITGGTRGTAGITYQLSYDGGRNYGPTTALGTATTITIPNAGGVIWAIATGTLTAGDLFTARSTAPCWTTAELGTALDALVASAVNWELVHVVGPLDATSAAIIDTKMSSMFASGKYHSWIGNARVPTIAETEATYATAMAVISAAYTTIYGEFCAGATKLTSSVSGRRYKRPWSFGVAAREASVSEEINIADVNLPPLTGMSIRDANGNADEHDESLNPGLDDLGFCVARTWDGTGVYVNRPRLMCPAGSDFQLMPHRRVINLGHGALRAYFLRRLNKPILVSKVTGFILESEALEIETGALAAMTAVLMAKPKASAVLFSLNRTDNVLSTKTINGQGRIIPLAYPEFFNLDVGFYNPALQIQAV
jgi:hypothetical protein